MIWKCRRPEADFSGLPRWWTRHGVEPQMFPFLFSNPFSRLLSACAVPERPWNTAVSQACRKLLGARPVSKELVDG